MSFEYPGVDGSKIKSAVRLPLPADVDFRGLPFVPIYWDRLQKSRLWLRAVRRPETFLYSFALWMFAYYERPAGSIEDSDDVLADASCCRTRPWEEIRAEVLKGWVAIEGRIHHPVVSEIVWTIWRERLEKRHENAVDSWRNASKRKMDKGLDPPEPPGPFEQWLEASFPETHLYMSVLRPTDGGQCPADTQSTSPDVRRTNGQNPADNAPKRSEEKVITPQSPPANGADGHAGSQANGRAWFAREHGRLRNEFGLPLANLLQSVVSVRGRAASFSFVNAYKGCRIDQRWVDPHVPGAKRALVFPSKIRAERFEERHGQEIATLCEAGGQEPIVVRWKRTDRKKGL